MKRKILLIIIKVLTCFFSSSYAQTYTTENPSVRSQNNNGKIERIVINNNSTQVLISVPRSKRWGDGVSFSSSTILVPNNELDINEVREANMQLPDVGLVSSSSVLMDAYLRAKKRVEETLGNLSASGYLIRSLGNHRLNTQYKINTKGQEAYRFWLHFDRIPPGCEEIYIREIVSNGFEWVGIKINNPDTHEKTGLTEYAIKEIADKNNDGIVGIYEPFDKDGYKLGCVKINETYKLIYLGSKNTKSQWKIGDVKATLRSSATPGVFKADWYMANKSTNSNTHIFFDKGGMRIVLDDEEDGYIKMYPLNQPNGIIANEHKEWSGSSFAISNDCIVTNYHVVENAKSIYVQGIKGDFSTKYSASVLISDKYNDIAILRINDCPNMGLINIPCQLKTSTSEVGEDVFVLGYPLTSTMGDEIKLTAGIISSKTGFQGDISLYQVSAPIQPGNSGGPLFDSQGNIIGIVSAKHTNAESVGYAIKASYLKTLLESNSYAIALPSKNSISSLSLPDKVKKLKNIVYLITCSNKETGENLATSIEKTPQLSRQKNEGLNITQVEVTDTQTIVTLEYDNAIGGWKYVSGWWVNIDPNTYIYDHNTVKKHPLLKVEGIPVSPNKHTFSSRNEKLRFKLIFSALPKGTKTFDLIENENSTWNCLDVEIP